MLTRVCSDLYFSSIGCFSLKENDTFSPGSLNFHAAIFNTKPKYSKHPKNKQKMFYDLFCDRTYEHPKQCCGLG